MDASDIAMRLRARVRPDISASIRCMPIQGGPAVFARLQRSPPDRSFVGSRENCTVATYTCGTRRQLRLRARRAGSAYAYCISRLSPALVRAVDVCLQVPWPLAAVNSLVRARSATGQARVSGCRAAGDGLLSVVLRAGARARPVRTAGRRARKRGFELRAQT
jgi:hypothetical protein